jgi:hypothetical protein
MRAISHFAIGVVPPGTAEGRSLSGLLFDGRPVGTAIRGSVLEAQFALDHGYLLLSTEDTPYEESLWITLLDRRFGIRDQMMLCAPYSPGILRGARIVADDLLEFSFFGEDRWRLKIGEAPMPRLRALWTWAAGMHRLSPGRHLQLTRMDDNR